MLRKNKWNLLISSLIILLPIVFGIIRWNHLPEQMVTHWGIDGTADGWSSRAFTVFFLPAFLLAIHWFCILCTRIDPKNKNQNSKVFAVVLWICPIVSLFVNTMIYTTAMGKKVEPYLIASLMLGILIIIIGNYLPKCRQNATIGIRVKWTLENEENWNATHRFCGKSWVIGGFLIMACSVLPKVISTAAFFVLLIVLSVLPIYYSYYYYRKMKKDSNEI